MLFSSNFSSHSLSYSFFFSFLSLLLILVYLLVFHLLLQRPEPHNAVSGRSPSLLDCDVVRYQRFGGPQDLHLEGEMSEG